MEIALSRKGEMHVLSVTGKIRLQNWRVLDKHLDNLLAKGARAVVLDLSGVTLICSVGVGAVLHNIRKFREARSLLLLFTSSAYVLEVFQIFDQDFILLDALFQDWETLSARAQAQGIAP